LPQQEQQQAEEQDDMGSKNIDIKSI